MRSTFVPIHAAGDGAWSWHLVEAELRGRGHDVVAIDMPADDESAGLWDYADAVVSAIGDRSNVVVVAHSFGGFTGPLVCERMPVDLLVMVTAMIPAPGEAPKDWWSNTGHDQATRGLGDQDDIATYYHDVPPELATEALERERASVKPRIRGALAPRSLAQRADALSALPGRPVHARRLGPSTRPGSTQHHPG